MTTRAAAIAVGVAVTLVLAACGGSSHHAVDSSNTASSAPVSGSNVVLKIGAASAVTLPVTCQQSAGWTLASGSSGKQRIDLTVAGGPLAAVYSTVGVAGMTIYQARDGLADNTGKPAGKITVNTTGSSYHGDLTFVSNTVTAAGKTVPAQGSNVSTGEYTLTCATYSAPPPAPPTTAVAASIAPPAPATPSTKASAPATVKKSK
jgi:hypothetical protein